MTKSSFLIAVALHLTLGTAKAVTHQEGASKLLSPKVALNKAMAAVDTSDENVPIKQDTTVPSISSLELMKLEQFAHDMKDKYAAQGNGTDDRLLRGLQESEPDCSATSDGGVKCCQRGQQSGADLCIYFYCPQQGQISDACTCRVQINGKFCNTCALCGDDIDIDFDCNNVQLGLASNVCPETDSYTTTTTTTKRPTQTQGSGNEGEADCKAVGGGGVECCNRNDKGINICMTFYCPGDTITGDCGCKMSLDGRTCSQCDICAGGESVHADCTNIGANALPVCPETLSGSDSGSGSGSGTGSVGTGTGNGGNSGGGSSTGSSNGGADGGSSGDGSTLSFPWSQGSGGATSSAVSVGTSGGLAVASIVIGGAVVNMF